MKIKEFYAQHPQVLRDNVYIASLLGIAEVVDVEGEDNTNGGTFAHTVNFYFAHDLETAIQMACSEAMDMWKKEEGWTRRSVSVQPVRSGFLNDLTELWQEGLLNKHPRLLEKGRMVDCDSYHTETTIIETDKPAF
jgi:hypothetical protein